MQPTRRARLEAQILEELSQILGRGLKDPRVIPLTLTQVKLTEDAGHAIAFFMPLGGLVNAGSRTDSEEAEYREMAERCLEGLQAASGFLRRQLGKVLAIRTIPSLSFQEDRGLENTHRVHELLQQIDSEKPSR